MKQIAAAIKAHSKRVRIVSIFVCLLGVAWTASLEQEAHRIAVARHSITGVCTPLPSILVSWYRSEGNAADSIYTNHGTLMNGPTFARGKVDEALSFDGINDIVEVPFNSAFDVANAVTIEAWVKTTSTVTVTVLNVSCPGAQRVWDGGGSTNNWSEAANWCNDQLPVAGSQVLFDATTTKPATIDVPVNVLSLTVGSGYGATITAVNDVTVTNLSLGSGLFHAPPGTLTINGNGLAVNPGTFDHNNGTVMFTGVGTNISIADPVLSLNNVIVEKAPGGNPVNITTVSAIVEIGGTLRLIEGKLTAVHPNNNLPPFTVFKAKGPVIIEPTFGEQSGGGEGGGEAVLLFQDGPAGRTITMPAGVFLPRVTVDDPNVTLTASGVGTARTSTFRLQKGTVDIDSTNVTIVGENASNGYDQSGGSFSINTGVFSVTNGLFRLSQPDINNPSTFTAVSGNLDLSLTSPDISGGTFNASSGTNTFGASFIYTFDQSGGIFNGNGTVDINGAFNLSGGTFNATPGNTSVGSTFNHTGGAFNPNGGTLIFDGSGGTVPIIAPGSGDTFNNLTINRDDGSGVQMTGDTHIVNGTLRLINGTVNSTTGGLQPQSNMIVEATADGGNGRITFGGAVNQTYTNNGGVNTTGIWTVDKSSANATLTATSSLNLGTSQALNITIGTLYLNNNSNLTIGALTIGANGRLVNDSATTITLGGNLANNGGKVDLQGGGAACPESPDTILIRSSDATQRSWTVSGSGKYRLVDVDVQNMGGSGTKTVYSGTDSGGNNPSWDFSNGNNCPTALSISPSVVDRYAGQAQPFTAGGGYAPLSFSIPTNNSGATIDPATGLYAAGTTINVSDAVRVTDYFGTTADSTVNVVPGPPTRTVFIVQPTNMGAGQLIAPAVQVALQDNAGNTITSATDAITVTIGNNPGGSMLTGTATKNAVNGIATFDDLSLNRTGTNYNLVASSGSLMSVTSGPFAISFGPPAQVGFRTQPIYAAANGPIGPPVEVEVRDQFGNWVTNATNQVSISLLSNPTGAALTGTFTSNAFGGVATFNNLRINLVGSGYTLLAASGSLGTATSDPFDVTNSYTVINTGSFGPGTLFDAVAWSQMVLPMHPTPTIRFNIQNTPRVIFGQAYVISRPVIIDGTTQPGYVDHPLIELNGSGLANGLGLFSGGHTIKGLAIYNYRDHGIQLFSSNNIIQGNYIGTAGTAPSGQEYGMFISDQAENNQIGGTTPNSGNVISGNRSAGILFFDSDNTIKGNFIGTNSNGLPIPNGIGIQAGYFFSGSRLIVGGTQPGESNVIAFNTEEGILDPNGDSMNVRGNSIHSNGGLGIDLRSRGVSPNDLCDSDHLPNFPDLTLVNVGAGNTTIEGSMNGSPGQTYVIDFFSSQSADPSGYGEGQTFLGSGTVTLSNSCTVAGTTFSVTLPVTIPVGHYITATATGSGFLANLGTSEFSPFIGPTASIQGSVLQNPATPFFVPVQVRLTATDLVRDVLTDSNGRFSFTNLPRGATYTVTPMKPNYAFTPRVYANLSASQDDTYLGTLIAFPIAGRVRVLSDPDLPGHEGVMMTLSGDAGATTTTTESGRYAFNDLPVGTYTVTPFVNGYSVDPPSRTFTLPGGSSQNADFYSTTLLFGLPGRIAYEYEGAGIYTMPATSWGNTLVQIAPTGESLSNPGWSKDGARLAFVKDVGPDRSIMTSNFDGSNLSGPIATFTTAHPELAWSPDGTKISFNKIVSGALKIFIVNSDGSGTPSQITTGGLVNDGADWSPNGQKLVFSRADSTTGNRKQLFTVDSTGTNQNLTRLTNDVSFGDFEPTWSPDGTKIAFLRSAAGVSWVVMMNANGTNQTTIATASVFRDLEWSPDGSRLAFTRKSTPDGPTDLCSILPDGGHEVIIETEFAAQDFDWAPTYVAVTPPGSPVTIGGGLITLNFPAIHLLSPGGAAGATTITPIAPQSAGDPPAGYNLANYAYAISTTAVYTPPVTVCFNLEAGNYATQAQFDTLRVLHGEGGILIDRTVLPNDFANRKVCASVNSFSPFVLAELVSPAMPRVTGLVIDQNGNPLTDIPIALSGDEERFTTTDLDGFFTFSNLIQDGNYIVQPNKIGYLFNFPYQSYVGITGEETVVFTATAADFDISGIVTNGNGQPFPGIAVRLSGAIEVETITDANGNYSFVDLLANGFYNVTPISSGVIFSPQQFTVDALQDNLVGIDFAKLTPTAIEAPLGGKVSLVNGEPLDGATVQLLNTSNGDINTAVTDFNGRYLFDNAYVGVTYVITPQHTGFSFNPTNQVVSHTGARTDLDFTAIPDSTTSRPAINDFDGDGRSDIGVFRPTEGTWYFLRSQTNSLGVAQWGSADDKLAQADYDGDRKTDVAVYRPSTGAWYILLSSTNSVRAEHFGLIEDIPIPRDYDGDGKADLAVWRPSEGRFYIQQSSTNDTRTLFLKHDGAVPIAGDFDGDGKSDPAVFTPLSGEWRIVQSSNDVTRVEGWGLNGDIPFAGNVDGDGKADMIVVRPSEARWYVRLSSNAGSRVEQFGLPDDKFGIGDYDGDGWTDLAVFRPTNGFWYLLNSTNGFGQIQFGLGGDRTIGSALH